MAGEYLLNAMKSVAYNSIPYTELTDALYGEVLSIKPLTIRIENRFEISESDGNLQVSCLCMENSIHFPKHHHHYPAPIPKYPEAPDCEELEKMQTEEPLKDFFPHNHIRDLESDMEIKSYTTLDFDRILLWRGLLVGDKVLVFRVARGQEYVVMHRLGNYSRDERITDGGGYR